MKKKYQRALEQLNVMVVSMDKAAALIKLQEMTINKIADKNHNRAVEEELQKYRKHRELFYRKDGKSEKASR